MNKYLLFFFLIFNVIFFGYSQSNNYANGNGSIIEERVEGSSIYIFRRHIQNLEIGDLSRAKNLIVYDKPYSENGNIIDRLERGVVINITQIVEVITANIYSYWVKINTDNITDGWIFGREGGYNDALSGIPYFENRWEILDVIQDGEKIWTVRKLIPSQVVIRWRYRNEIRDIINIYDKPGFEDKNIISKITRPENWWSGDVTDNILVTPISATEETERIEAIINEWPDRWIKINYDGVEGWIFGGFTDVNRGGHKFYTPENIISFTFGWY